MPPQPAQQPAGPVNLPCGLCPVGLFFRPALRWNDRMIPDLDIYRSAQVLVKQHGQDAPIHAAMQADAMLEKGDLAGYAV